MSVKRILSSRLFHFGFVAIVLIAAYVGISYRHWQAYTNRSDAVARQEGQIGLVIKSEARAESEHDSKLGSLRRALADYQSLQLSCRSSWWVDWQSAVPGVRKEIARCVSLAKDKESLSSRSHRLVTFLEDEKKFLAVLAPARQLTVEMSPSNWGEAVATWHKVENEISSLEPGEDFQPVREDAVRRLKEINASWQEIIVADEQKDKTIFLSKKDTLIESIGKLQEISAIEKGRLAAILAELSKSL